MNSLISDQPRTFFKEVESVSQCQCLGVTVFVSQYSCNQLKECFPLWSFIRVLVSTELKTTTDEAAIAVKALE